MLILQLFWQLHHLILVRTRHLFHKHQISHFCPCFISDSFVIYIYSVGIFVEFLFSVNIAAVIMYILLVFVNNNMFFLF